MVFEKIGKGEALVWIAGGVSVEAVLMLLASALNFTYLIPEVGFSPLVRRFYTGMFVVALLFAYVIFRTGTAGERPRKVVSLFFSGVMGSVSIAQLFFAVMGWSLVVPRYGFVYGVNNDPLAYGMTWLIATIMAAALWMHAKKDGAKMVAAVARKARKR